MFPKLDEIVSCVRKALIDINSDLQFTDDETSFLSQVRYHPKSR
jgi:hypothetical protein